MNASFIEILLVEDNLDDAELILRSLRQRNVANKITHVKDGVEALEFLEGTGQYTGRDVSAVPRLIMLDLKMPKMSGIEVLKRIKTNEDTRKIPVVILTSSREDPDIKKCYALGANSYIVKPVEFDNFREVVSKLGLYWMMINQPPV